MERFTEEDIQKIKSGNLFPLKAVYLAVYLFIVESLQKYNNCPLEDAEDVTMEAIQVLREKIYSGTFINKNIKSFLLEVAKNIWRNKNRRDRKSLEFDPKIVEAYLVAREVKSELNESQQAKVNAAILAVEQLGDGCEKLIRLNVYEGIPLKELQNELGYKNYDVIKSMKSRCMKKLKELINTIMNKNNGSGIML